MNNEEVARYVAEGHLLPQPASCDDELFGFIRTQRLPHVPQIRSDVRLLEHESYGAHHVCRC